MTVSVSERLTLAARPLDRQVASLSALAIVLALIDAALPTPLPGVKPGLANIVTLLALYRLGFAAAVWVSLLRVLGAALLMGSMLTPGFFLSLAGALASLALLAPANYLPRRLFGPVSLSLIAAYGHIGGQLLLARLWLIPSDGILYFVPAFALAALITGTVNGLLAARLLWRWPSTPH